ncbi:MAG: phage GP46 family protein [Hyphomicrobiaceae bacterium]
MADIRVAWDAEAFAGDWLLAGVGLDTTRELVTAVAVALFTWATAEADDPLPAGDGDRKGWWGDHEAAEIHGGWRIGSRLWLLVREKQTESTRARAEAYIREALEPFVDIGLCERVDVAVDWFAPERLGAEIVMTRGPNDRIAVRFERLWDEIAANYATPPPLPVQPEQLFDHEFSQEFA